MKPVLQTRFGVPDGNCFSACVASILEVPIEEVPAYQCDLADEVYWHRWVVWLWEHGWQTDWWKVGAHPTPEGYAILGVDTPLPHSVVALDGAVVWNPHHNVPLPPESVWKDWTVLTRRIM